MGEVYAPSRRRITLGAVDLNAPTTRGWLTLGLTRGIGPKLLGRARERFGSVEAAVDAPATAWAELGGVGRVLSARLHAAMRGVQRDGTVDAELEAIAQSGAWLVNIDEPEYPALLRHIPDPPPLLWGRGAMTDGDALSLAIVGSRKCTLYGREQAERFASACSAAGLTIVSGGAYGIDAAAHRAVLRQHDMGGSGRTVAVIGSGLSNPYPTPHAEMFDEVVGRGGAVLSELPMHAPPKATQFPARNRIISGLSLGVLVVEAAQRSGALITARLAVEEHGRECMAVPGRVDSPASAGCHHILRQSWATLVTRPQDVLDQLGDAGSLLQLAEEDAAAGNGVPAPAGAAGVSLFEQNLTEPQQKIVAACKEPRTLDELVALTGLDAAALRTAMTMLELRGTIQRQGAMFVRHGR